ncbi:D-lactate ferricytochrome c oxidoreductase [Diaporthe eres]|uniref:D-lactate dehydrogenase (cytochrome) n=1 Tax=Diaporthe eres TaxID=83184 RepID=A0ABR1PFX4_DIAER
MSVRSAWRALPPACALGRRGAVACRGINLRASPALSITAKPNRRFASTDNATTAAKAAPSPAAGADSAPAWTGNGVFGVALLAGVLGWGLATLATGGKGKGSTLLDSKKPLLRYASMREMEIAIQEIRDAMDPDVDIISTDPDDLHAHGYSEWSTVNTESLPVAVAYPRSTADVSTIAQVCYKYHVPIIPYSGGTSLEGARNFSAPFGGISVDFAYMDQIVQFNQEDMDIVVQPSIGWQDLNEQLNKMGSGLFFPVDPATLKLAVVPEDLSVAVVTFPTIRDAAAAAAEVMQTGIPVAAMEIMDEVQMRVVNLGGATAPRVWDEVPTLFFKFSGTKASVKENIGSVQRIAKRNSGSNFEFAKDSREQKLLWSARKESLWSMLALRKGGEEVWSTDVAVPFSRLADIIEVSKKEMDELGLFASILGHIGDGNFHESILYNPVNGEREKVEECVKRMVKRAIDMEGTCTGEHSIGWGKKESLLLEVGPETLDVMRDIKASLDPRWIM